MNKKHKQAPEELLAQAYPTTVNEVIVMSQIVGILIGMVVPHIKDDLQINDISQDDIDFILVKIAESAQKKVDKYSVEQITEYLSALNLAKQAAVQTGKSVLLATSPQRLVQE